MGNDMGDKYKNYKPDELPSSITRKLYVHYRISGHSAGQIDIFDFALTSDPERVMICEKEVTIKIPRIDRDGLKSKALEVLKREKQKIMADSHMKVRAIQDKIDDLLAIEYKQN